VTRSGALIMDALGAWTGDALSGAKVGVYIGRKRKEPRCLSGDSMQNVPQSYDGHTDAGFVFSTVDCIGNGVGWPWDCGQSRGAGSPTGAPGRLTFQVLAFTSNVNGLRGDGS
jgi:hypothetical protein